jgi:mevalonate kinase
MIPQSFQDLWQQGLDEGHFALKLCGAGGGGFLLGMGKPEYLPAKAILLK